MANYAQHFNPRQTPQTEKADAQQVENSAGGYTFEVTPWQRLQRWLVLGADGGTYYASERELTRENAQTIQECLRLDGARTVETIAAVSEAGQAPKNDPAVFALALAASCDNPETRRAALAALPRVCRIGTHLFQFAECANAFRGWGRQLKRAVARWYTEKTPEQVAYQVAKYGQRGGWSHRDLIRLAHPEQTEAHAAIFRYVATGAEGLGERTIQSGKWSSATRRYPALGELPPFLAAFEELKRADEKRTIALIREHRFTHEMIDSRHKNSADVWEALLENMPMTAMVRNLGKMSEVGLLKPMSRAVPIVAEQLTSEERLKKARVHPIAMLSALRVYAQGHGERGKLSWTPVPQIVDALDAGFYAAFGAIEPSGKRTLLAIDVSGSMAWESAKIAGISGLYARDVAACLAMVTARTEKQHHILAFADGLMEVSLSPRQRLDDIIGAMSRLPASRTDCALPMLWAAGSDVGVDVFHVYTDSETYAGTPHPHQALRAYRAKSGIAAKLAVVGMASNGFTIADPSDPGMLDVVGCDTATPNVLADFARGE